MPTISEVRQKYPQYADMSDQQLADALHSKFYADIPKADFYGRIGLGSQDPAIPTPAQVNAEATANKGGGPLRYIDNLVRQGANALTFGFADELSAGASQLTGIGPTASAPSYDAALAQERARDKGFEQSNPVAATGAQIAGSMLSFGPGAAMAARAPTIGGKILKSATVAAPMGALTGFGQGEGGVENRLEKAQSDGLLAAGIGAVLPPVAIGAGKAVNAVKDALAPLTEGGRQRLARQQLAEGVTGVKTKADEFQPAVQKAIENIDAAQAQAQQINEPLGYLEGIAENVMGRGLIRAGDQWIDPVTKQVAVKPYQPTTGVAIGTPNALGAEQKARLQAPDQFIARDAQNNEALTAYLRTLDSGDPAVAQRAIGEIGQAKIAEAENAASLARAEAEAAAQLRGDVRVEGAGRVLLAEGRADKLNALGDQRLANARQLATDMTGAGDRLVAEAQARQASALSDAQQGLSSARAAASQAEADALAQRSDARLTAANQLAAARGEKKAAQQGAQAMLDADTARAARELEARQAEATAAQSRVSGVAEGLIQDSSRPTLSASDALLKTIKARDEQTREQSNKLYDALKPYSKEIVRGSEKLSNLVRSMRNDFLQMPEIFDKVQMLAKYTPGQEGGKARLNNLMKQVDDPELLLIARRLMENETVPVPFTAGELKIIAQVSGKIERQFRYSADKRDVAFRAGELAAKAKEALSGPGASDNVRQTYRNASSFYAAERMPFRDGVTGKLLSGDVAESNALNAYIRPNSATGGIGGKEAAQEMIKVAGRAAAERAAIDHFAQMAKDKATAGAKGDTLSPQAIRELIRDYSNFLSEFPAVRNTLEAMRSELAVVKGNLDAATASVKAAPRGPMPETTAKAKGLVSEADARLERAVSGAAQTRVAADRQVEEARLSARGMIDAARSPIEALRASTAVPDARAAAATAKSGASKIVADAQGQAKQYQAYGADRLRTEKTRASAATKMADDYLSQMKASLAAAEKTAQKAPGEWAKSMPGFFADGGHPEATIKTILGKADAPERMRELMSAANAAGQDAVDGVKQAVTDHILKEASQTSRFTSASGKQIGELKLSASAIEDLIGKSKKFRATMEKIYSPDEMRRLDTLHEQVSRIQKLGNRATSGSPTAENAGRMLSADNILGLMLGKGGAAAGGAIGGVSIYAQDYKTTAATGLVALTAWKTRAGRQQIQEIVNRALVEPDLAQIMLSKAIEENARKAVSLFDKIAKRAPNVGLAAAAVSD
jgi:hypothetical protein